jgi:hypothetical protein
VLDAVEDEIADLARVVLGRTEADVREWWVEDVGYQVRSPTTAGLLRVRGVATDRDRILPWSVFVKVLQSWRHWPMLHLAPKRWRDLATSGTNWRYEADVYAFGLDDVLPDGLRLADCYHGHDIGDDRFALWLEDVRPATTPWDLDRFERAARLLGRLAARSSQSDVLSDRGAALPGSWTRLYSENRIEPVVIPALGQDAVWYDPLVREAGDDRLRRDLFELVDRLPRLLDALDHIPGTPVHGDACPQNLLVPEDDPTSFVVVDWSMAGRAAVGFDLGQLLVGLAHDGELTVDELPALHDAIVAAYAGGLAEDGLGVRADDVRFGCDAALVVRSAFTALPLEQLGQPPTDDLARLWRSRVELTRYLVDLGLSLPLTR